MPELKRMSQNQMETFVQMAQLGVAMGLMHPFEWLYNATRVTGFMSYEQQPAANDKIVDAFLAFWHGTDSQPNDPCTTITAEELFVMINEWYARGRDRNEYPPAKG